MSERVDFLKDFIGSCKFMQLRFFGEYICVHGCDHGRQTGGGVGGVSTPPEFWMGGLNTCQPPPDFEKKNLGGVGSP